ncbi:MAG TPA: pirin family protein [Saprospiraceae bacterium]|nr:pirin family protein [Saprospiraceae bacterium]
MNHVIHKAGSRGFADHGWLQSYHSFSFAQYYNPERMGFGALRVLNDDTVAPGRGFGMHPHDNMEIISIPLEGDLEHKDSMGNTTVIRKGDIQIMSAGTGVFHSEYNKNRDQPVKFLQIWMIPKLRNVKPRYDQITLDWTISPSEWKQILSPDPDDEGVWVNQDAWFYMGRFGKGVSFEYSVQHPDNGIYLFLLEGGIEIHGEKLGRRDAMGIWNSNTVIWIVNEPTHLLLMEIPMLK